MPGAYSGLDLADKLATNRPDLKVVLMTGFGREGLSAPGIRVLQKPFGRRTLMRAFRDAFTAMEAV